MKIKAIIRKSEEGGYWAEVPALPGCFSEGETLDEVKANIAEAVEGYLEVAGEEVEKNPDDEIYEIPA